jgi:hypothetical protein
LATATLRGGRIDQSTWIRLTLMAILFAYIAMI